MEPLSVRLREGTKKEHHLSEHTPFMQKFFRGQLSIEVYREFLVQLLHIYMALEKDQERHREHGVFGKIYFPELYRRDALEQDLNFYYGNKTWKDVVPLKATQNYVSRINTLSAKWVEGLVAHHYTRYLGDLSGGQALKGIVAKTYSLSSDQGLAFYDFPQITDYKQFKDEYRAELDSMRIDDTTFQNIINEANQAFVLNQDIFISMMDILE
jgi:heme oxygenase